MHHDDKELFLDIACIDKEANKNGKSTKKEDECDNEARASMKKIVENKHD